MTEPRRSRLQALMGVSGERAAFVLVVLLTFACFAPSLSNGLLVWDDSGYISENTQIRSLSLETIGWALNTFYCNYWAPLTWISLALDYAVWGLNPTGYHLTNILIHALNAGLFFMLSRELIRITQTVCSTERASGVFLQDKNIVACALLAALFFSLHPLRVESVAWAAERKDVLFLFFGLLAVLAYLRYVRNQFSLPVMQRGVGAFLSSRIYWVTVLFFTLSLFSKSMLVTLPLVLLILDWFPLRRFAVAGAVKGILLEKVPLFTLSCIVSVIAILSQGPSVVAVEQSDMLSRALIAIRSVMEYLGYTLWPAGLGPFYWRPMVVGLLDPAYALPVAGFLIVSLICLVAVKRWKVIFAIWLIYLVTLLPVLGLAKVGPVSVADRFTYLPSLPISLLFSLGVTVTISRFSHLRAAFAAGVLVVGVILVIISFLTVRQIAFWKDDVTLWTRAIDIESHMVGRPYFERSFAYAIRGEFSLAMEDIDKAISIAENKHYNRMFELYASRARIFAAKGDFERALYDYERVINNSPYQEKAGFYMERGMLFRSLGKDQLAEDDFRSAGVPGGPQ